MKNQFSKKTHKTEFANISCFRSVISEVIIYHWNTSATERNQILYISLHISENYYFYFLNIWSKYKILNFCSVLRPFWHGQSRLHTFLSFVVNLQESDTCLLGLMFSADMKGKIILNEFLGLLLRKLVHYAVLDHFSQKDLF